MSLIDEFSKSDLNTISLLIESVNLYIDNNRRQTFFFNKKDNSFNNDFNTGPLLTSNEVFVLQCFKELLLKSMENIEQKINDDIEKQASDSIDNLIQDLYNHLARED